MGNQQTMAQGLTISARITKGGFTLFCICLLFFHPGIRTVAARDLEADEVKAAFILNFTRFVQWPENAIVDDANQYRICVFGNKNLEKELNTIGGKKSGNASIQVHHIDPHTFETDDALPQCHVVFIGKHISHSESQRILQHIDGKPILSIGESRNFTRMGGIIKFFTKDDRLHFEVNVKAAQAHGLKFSSRLLRLAIIVD